MSNASQSDRIFKVTTSKGTDKLLFCSMEAREDLSSNFEISLKLLSEDRSIGIKDLLGQTMTVSVPLSGGGTRYFHGIVSRFKYAGTRGSFALYEAELVPWLWCLTRTADCRIFQQMSVPDIIKQVFRDHGFSDFSDKLTHTYTDREYCVQYRESDFAFVNRLMEQEGIYYYFDHSSSKHTLCLCDDVSSHSTVTDYAKVPFVPPGNESRRETEHIFDWAVTQEVSTGTVTLNDYDFENPKTDLLVKSMVSRGYTHGDFEIYDYPGSFSKSDAGEAYARKRVEENTARQERVEGRSNAAGLETGAIFTLEDHPRSDQNRQYLLTSTTYYIANNEYENLSSGDGEVTREVFFSAMQSGVPYRTHRTTPMPAIHGPQTAVVVGKKGEEIWTDKYGRVKVQFHWDRLGKKDENSSCWVRVSQLWAGKSWGAMHIPRVGQEVIVEFLEGDPDRPIITGRLYNADEMPPYTLPDQQTQSGIKSRSTKEATDQNFNELRFDDKKGEESIYFHAEKDFERVVENNDSLKVGLEGKADGNQSIEIHNNQTMIVGNDESAEGNQILTIWKDQKETLKTGNKSVVIEKGDESVEIKEGSRTSVIKTNDTLTLTSGDHTIQISAGKSVIEAASSIELKVGPSSILIDPSGITLKSTNIEIKGDGKIDLESIQTTCKGSGQLTLQGGMIKLN
ncbi:MAG: type VI secretion system Vgr family protein [Rubripirellula sp.]